MRDEKRRVRTARPTEAMGDGTGRRIQQSVERSGRSWFRFLKPDSASGRVRRRRKEWLELDPDRAERVVVRQECFINFRKPFQDGGVGGQLLAHLQEGAYDKHAHRHGFGTIEHGRGHDGAMLGEGERTVGSAPVPFGTGHKL